MQQTLFEVNASTFLEQGERQKPSLSLIFFFNRVQIFNQLAKRQPKFRHKIVGIKGDIGLPGLGICESDKELLKLKVSDRNK